MSKEWLVHILEKVKSGELPVDDAVAQLTVLPYEDIGYAKINHHRALRLGLPEVILGQGKTAEQVVTIAEHLAARADRLLITKVSADVHAVISQKIPDAIYDPTARVIVVNRVKDHDKRPGIVVVSGGTADIPVAEEAAITAELMGNKVDRIYDIGVAGLHRLLDSLPQLRQAQVLIAVAGMEGALPSIIGGLVPLPIIAVPTSVGYGASFRGFAALLTMLNSCAPGVAVVNIDNGFGAGYLAGLINRP